MKTKIIKYRKAGIILAILFSLFSEFTYGQNSQIKIDLLNNLVKNHKLNLQPGESIEKYIPYLKITEMKFLDNNWNRDYGVYRFEIESEQAPDMLIKIKDKYYIQDQKRLDNIIEAILDLSKTSRGTIRPEDIILYIKRAIQIYRDNVYVKNERIIG